MELNGTNIGAELVLGFILLILFSIGFNFAIHKLPWLANRRPAEQVVIGDFVTIVVSGFVIGWLNALAVFILFAGAGLPMLIGSWVRAAQDDEQAKQIAKEALTK